MQNFIIEISFRKPPIIQKRLVGDSLLAGILNEKYGGDWERAISEAKVLIDHKEGVAQFSDALLYYPASRALRRIDYTQSFMRDLFDPAIHETLDKQPNKSELTVKSGPLKNQMSGYEWLDVGKIYYVGRGDVDAIHGIMRHVSFIGTQRNKGHGEIAAVDIWPVKTDNPWCGIIGTVDGRNTVLRPVPLRLKPVIPVSDHMVASETWHNPYQRHFAGSVVESCMVPPFRSGHYFAQRDVETALALTVSS